MTTLRAEIHREKDRVLVLFSGALTEASTLDLAPSTLGEAVTLDLQEIRRINSAGAQLWTQWLRGFTPEQRLRFERLPPAFVQLASVVEGVLPPSATVESFFVPYFDESRGESENVLFVREKQFTDRELMLPPFLRSPVTNQPLEIDVVPEKYFQFLKRCYPGIVL